jgi:phosphomevalonate kinase
MASPQVDAAQTLLRATAPGKLVLLGEYVVLEGAPALVAAMDRRAEAHFASHTAAHWQVDAPTLGAQATLRPAADGGMHTGEAWPKSLSFAVAALQRAHRILPVPYGRLTLRTDAFFENDIKLGLGSSAAVSCACWQVLQAASKAQAPAAELDALQREVGLEAVNAVHHQVQGRVGSGVDVAASLWGGIVRFERRNPAAPPRIARVAPLSGCVLLPVWSGSAAATAPKLSAFAALKAARPDVYWRDCETLASLAQAGADFWALGHIEALLAVVNQVHDALAQLGEHMDSPIVTPAHQAIADIARRAGAAYKPSGAGGGDLGIAVCPSRRVANRVTQRLRAAGFKPMPMRVDAAGARLER